MNKSIISALGTCAMLLGACTNNGTDEKDWTVEGTVAENAKGAAIYLEAIGANGWEKIDSAIVADELTYSFGGTRPEFPQIYRISFGCNTIYFPIDSIENITIDADMKISGSQAADMMQRINEIIASDGYPAGASDFADSTKMKVARIMGEDFSSIASYYALNKTVDNVPLFNPSISFDRRIIGGVATQFKTRRPDDPRVTMLENAAINSQRLFSSQYSTSSLQATEVPFIELNLNDVEGKAHSLTTEWKGSSAIILNFTAQSMPESPALNVLLNKIYETYSNRGVKIYQVSCDEDEFAWASAARSLPWTSVYNSPIHNAVNLASYNISTIPVTFVISGDGQKMERVDNPSEIESVLKKML